MTAVIGISSQPIEAKTRAVRSAICARPAATDETENTVDFKAFLNKKPFILLDGAMGTMIQKSGAKYEHVPETLNITSPELITSFHKAYIAAGADIVYSNTFGANAYKLADCGYSVNEIIRAGAANAKKACEGTPALAALDIVL